LDAILNPSTNALSLEELTSDFARGIELADSKSPIATNSRSGISFQAGIGPHKETAALSLVLDELKDGHPSRYSHVRLGVPYPEMPRQRCDFCIGQAPEWDWAIEAKLVRFLGDNGKPNSNMLMHLLSPYPVDRSALTDCSKLASTSLGTKRAVLIYGFDSKAWPLETAIRAFEALSTLHAVLGPRIEHSFANLRHPIHNRGAVFAWEVLRAAS
jgi:hypothetical protein